MAPGSTASKTFTVRGEHIYTNASGDVTLSVSNSAFTVSAATLTKAQVQANGGASVTITYNPTTSQDYTGTLTISTKDTDGQSTKSVVINLIGHSKVYYSKVDATVDPTGAGTVYVGNATTDSPTYAASSSNSQNTHSRESVTHNYYLYAQAGADYEFARWTENNTQESTANPYTAAVAATSTTESSPTTKNYTAVFNRLPASLSASISSWEVDAAPGSTESTSFTVSGEHIYTNANGDVTLSVDNSAFTVSPATLTKAQAEAGASVTITYNPTASQEYTGKLTISTQGVDDVEINLIGHSTTYYSKVNATVDASGIGTVFVGNESTDSPTYAASSSSSQNTPSRESVTHNYYLYAQAGADYEFAHWAENGTQVSTDNPFTATVAATSTTESSPTTKNYTAVFTRLPASLTADATSLEFDARPRRPKSQTVRVSGLHLLGDVTLSVDNNVFTVSPATLTKAEAEAGADVTITFEPADYQNYTGTLTVSSQGVSDVTIALNGYAEAYVVTIGQARATTLYVDIPLVIPTSYYENFDGAFYVDKIDPKEGNKYDVVLHSMVGIIPANTAVVITGAPGIYHFTKYRDSTEPISSNLLQGCLTSTPKADVLKDATEGSLVMTLAVENEKLGFYKYVGKTLAANRAYLIFTPPAGSNVSHLSIAGFDSDESLDGIRDAKAVVADDDAWYTLQGAKLAGQPTQRGIYIHGGKKVMVK